MTTPAIPEELESKIKAYVLQPDGSGQRPYADYARLRAAEPLHRTPDGVWIVTSHAAYSTLLRDPRISRQEAARTEMGDVSAAPSHVREALEAFPQMIINQDGTNHQRLRRLIRNAFLPGFVETWRPRIEEIAKDVVDRALTLDTFDYVAEVGYPLPERVMTELIGVPDGHRAIWAGWSREITRFSRSEGGRAPDVSAAQEAMAKFYSYMTQLVEERHASDDYGGDDMLSVLLRAEDEGDRLSKPELISTMVALTQAAHETTANLVPNGTMHLLRDRERFAELGRNPDLVPTAVEEMLRFESPSASVLPRVALKDIEYDGVVISAGERIVFLTAAINRDPAVFSDPDSFDYHRADLAKHLAFGNGPHVCIGQHLARLEAATIIREVVTRMPDLELVEEPRFSSGRARHLVCMMVRNKPA